MRLTSKEAREKHEKHLQEQKDMASYNNATLGHHTNAHKNIVKKLVNSGVDGRSNPLFPITLLFKNSDFEVLKRRAAINQPKRKKKKVRK